MAQIKLEINGAEVLLDADEARRILRELREVLEPKQTVPYTGPGYINPIPDWAPMPPTPGITWTSTGTPAILPTVTTSTGSVPITPTGTNYRYPNVVLNSDMFE